MHARSGIWCQWLLLSKWSPVSQTPCLVPNPVGKLQDNMNNHQSVNGTVSAYAAKLSSLILGEIEL